MKGIFTISLDFELHWGGFEKWPLSGYRQYFLNTREVIPRMLELFSLYEVHVTWATVGMLFNRTRDELLANSPVHTPGYNEPQLSAYSYIQNVGIGDNERDDPFHFAPTLIEQIIKTPGQELASHTYAHFYCNEPGQTPEQFRADLMAAQKAASVFDRTLTSLVFPRNQFNDQYLRICYETGITAVRSNPRDWFWKIGSTQKESAWKRLNRGVDAYIPVGNVNSYALDSITWRDGYPLCIPASRLLRPYDPKELFLNAMKVKRIQDEMKSAAARSHLYHLWWHPHNFGLYPDQSLTALEKILKCYAECNRSFGMASKTMREVASLVEAHHGVRA
jgi:peptidoglycan/xylan/chitin deacetylase (PgdA/CDA1 family)